MSVDILTDLESGVGKSMMMSLDAQVVCDAVPEKRREQTFILINKHSDKLDRCVPSFSFHHRNGHSELFGGFRKSSVAFGHSRTYAVCTF